MKQQSPEPCRCRYCNGTGQTPPAQSPTPAPARRLPTGPLPPFGIAVAERVRADASPPGGVQLFIRPCPVTDKDAWALAEQVRKDDGPGGAMVLPIGADPAEYRWPPIPIRFVECPALVVWAYGMTAEEEVFYGEGLIAAGYDVVDVRGGPTGPLRFKAG